jgi:hypothetical protein
VKPVQPVPKVKLGYRVKKETQEQLDRKVYRVKKESKESKEYLVLREPYQKWPARQHKESKVKLDYKGNKDLKEKPGRQEKQGHKD